MTQAASDLRELYGVPDKKTADRMLRIFRAALVTRRTPGRKPSKEVLAAVELKERGWSWPRIYAEVFADWQSWPFYERSYKKFNLRKAVMTRRRRLR